jgi:hypothetical protein
MLTTESVVGEIPDDRPPAMPSGDPSMGMGGMGF